MYVSVCVTLAHGVACTHSVAFLFFYLCFGKEISAESRDDFEELAMNDVGLHSSLWDSCIFSKDLPVDPKYLDEALSQEVGERGVGVCSRYAKIKSNVTMQFLVLDQNAIPSNTTLKVPTCCPEHHWCALIFPRVLLDVCLC